MIVDPTIQFFAGITSSFGRTMLATLAVAAGAAVCDLSRLAQCSALDLLLWIPMLGVLPFWWASYGAACLIGLLAGMTMSVSVCLFVFDHQAKQSFFTAFSAAALYYAPVSFVGFHWIYALALYVGCTLLYWGMPWWSTRRHLNKV